MTALSQAFTAARCALSLFALLMATLPAHADPPSGETTRLAQAFETFDQATQLGEAAATDPSQLHEFRAAMLAAAIEFEAVIQDHSPTAGLHRNTATAYAFAGEFGRAMLHARRAEHLDPTDPAVSSMLDHLRTRVATRVDPNMRTSTAEALLGWRGHIPRQALLWTAIASYAVAMLCLGWLILRTRRTGNVLPQRLALATGLLCTFTAAPLALEWRLSMNDRDAVVIAQSVTGHNGPNPAVFDPTFDQPIGAGMEVRVIETRDTYSRVRLRNGKDTWIRADSIEQVIPSARSR